MNVDGKVVVITGAAQGLGRQIAIRLGIIGAKLALIDLNLDKLLELQAELNSKSIDTEIYAADISNETAVETTFSSIASHYKKIDVLINNAGIIKDHFLTKPNKKGDIDSMSLSNWQSVIDVNLTGVFLCARQTSKIMQQNKNHGVIVNISSISRAGNVGQSNYSAAKSGVVALTVTWAKELAKAGIRVGAVAPGFIKTDMTDSIKPEILKNVESLIPLRRFGQPDEIAHTVQFIIENDYFTGRLIEVDGGLRI